MSHHSVAKHARWITRQTYGRMVQSNAIAGSSTALLRNRETGSPVGGAAASPVKRAPGVRRRVNPYKERSFDGMALHPLEVMFVKMKGILLDQGLPAATTVETLDRWMQHQV